MEMNKHTLLSALGALLLAFKFASGFAGEQVTYFHGDMLGSPVAATDEKGYVKWRATYEPFGERIQSATDAVVSADQSVWYSGHVQDVESGLMYMEARYQDPQIGRFFSVDPASFDAAALGSFNRYAYGFNNPYRFVDPNGMENSLWDTIFSGWHNLVPQGIGTYEAGARQLYGPSLVNDPVREIFVQRDARMWQAAAHATAEAGNQYPIMLASFAMPGPDELLGLAVVSKMMSRPLFHYTTEAGMKGILESGRLMPSLKSVNPSDARYGNGQYLSNIQPGTMSCAQLSRCFLGQPFQGQRFTNYVEIDTAGLNVVRGRNGVFVVPNEAPLNLGGRILVSGVN
jgi:RHS repeat-associated protein